MVNIVDDHDAFFIESLHEPLEILHGRGITMIGVNEREADLRKVVLQEPGQRSGNVALHEVDVLFVEIFEVGEGHVRQGVTAFEGVDFTIGQFGEIQAR